MTPTPHARSDAVDSRTDDTETEEDEASARDEGAPGAPDEPAMELDDLGLEEMRTRFQRIDDAVERLRSIEVKREARFDRLHGELEQHRNQHYERLADPVLRALIQHYDTVAKLCATWERRPPEDRTPERLLGILHGLREDVEVLLHQQGAESFFSPRDSFDGARQTVARAVATDDDARVGTVAARLRPGFEIGDRLLAKERVAVFVKSSAQAVRPSEESESSDRGSADGARDTARDAARDTARDAARDTAREGDACDE